MDDTLLSYYNRELNYMRKSGAEFSEKHPKIAGRLRLDKDIVEDPHVSRLVESFAFLTARIRHSLDDSFPELTEALMGVLSPDYHAPIPSFSIVECKLLSHLQQKVSVAQGDRLRLSDDVGNDCYYRACAGSDVLPVTIDAIQFLPLPVKAPSLPSLGNQKRASTQSILKIKLSPFDKEEIFEFKQNNLRFYLNAQPSIAHKLHQVLLNNVTGIAIAENAFDTQPIFFSSSSIESFGFNEAQKMLPPTSRASLSHQLLVEYFLLPQKFLFVTLNDIDEAWERYPNGFEIFIYFDTLDTELLAGVDNRSLLLGCTPVVNLFEANSEPLRASEIGHEVMLRPGKNEAEHADIYSVESVYAINAEGEKIIIPPFYGHHLSNSVHNVYWSLRRENSTWQNGNVSHGTDTYISFVDADYNVISPDSQWIINADLLCINRDQPNKLSFGPDQPAIEFLSGGAGLRAHCLTPPTHTVLPNLNNATRWQLVSQLSLQHFSGKDGLHKLKETLSIYNLNKSKEVSKLIGGIVDLKVELTTAKMLSNGRSTMCQGTHFLLTCDESHYTGYGLYLFGLLMDEFLSQFCTINSFTQVSIKTTRYSRVEFSWLPRVGCQTLI